MMNLGLQQFPTEGFWLHRFTDEELAPLREAVNLVQSDFSKADLSQDNLAGQIKHEYTLDENTRTYLDYLISPQVREYDASIGYMNKYCTVLSDNRRLMIERAWVNFQQQGEYNPTHKHSGVFSFVIWLQVPYYIDEEQDKSPGKNSNHPISGNFEFIYTSVFGQTRSYPMPVDKGFENYMIIFPASMTHSVYPFCSSDQFRISVSGNFVFQV